MPPLATDARTSRARTALVVAARELLEEREVIDLSITLICSRAGVSRPSFYEHFGDVGALVHAAAIEELAAIFAELEPVDSRAWATTVPGVVREIVAGLAGRRLVFRRVLAGPSAYPFVRSVLGHVVTRITDNAPLDGRPAGTAEFLAAGATALVVAELERPDFADSDIDPLAQRVSTQILAALGALR